MKVIALLVVARTMGPQSATLTLDLDGVHKTVHATGNARGRDLQRHQALVPHEGGLEL